MRPLSHRAQASHDRRAHHSGCGEERGDGPGDERRAERQRDRQRRDVDDREERGSALPKPATMGKVSTRPSRPPHNAINNDSPKMRATRCRPVKPSVLRTAYSRVRSRTAMRMVFASTSRMMPTITTEMTCSDVMIALDIATKLCWN